MKKYKLEFSIGIFFIVFVVILIWQRLVLISQYLPVILLAICFSLILYLISPLGDKKNKNTKDLEAYAPKYYAQSVISCIIGVSIIIFIAVLLNKNNFSKTYDLTSDKINSLSDESNKFLESLSKKVQIICVPSASPTEKYCENNSEIINIFAKKSKFIENIGNLEFSDTNMIQKFEPSGYSRFILITDTNKSEIEGAINENKLINGLINLIKFKKTVYFLSGNGEPSILSETNVDRSYSDIVSTLHAKSYDVKEWNIKQGNLPEEARVLVAGDNNITYGEEVQNIIQNFIANGGNLVLIVNPYHEQGLEKLYNLFNLKLDPILLTLNSKTSIGQQIAKQNLPRPPVIASNFNIESPITKVIAQKLGAQANMPIDGARPISILTNDVNNSLVKTTASVLFSAYSAAPITITPEQRNKINLNAPFYLNPDSNFDENRLWPLAVSVEINGISHFAKDKLNNKDVNQVKNKSNVVVYGFSLVGPYSKETPISDVLLPLTIAHLYQDQELVSIPPKEFVPKQFNLSRNPSAWLPFFAGILPVITVLTGMFIWAKRRSS